MDKVIKEEADNQHGESSQSYLQPVAEPCDKLAPVPSDLRDEKGREQHQPHSFKWSCDDKTVNVTCHQAGTVKDALKKSDTFSVNEEKNKNKELVILKDGKAVSHHCPCSLIDKDERLIVKYIKAGDKPPDSPEGDRLTGELVLFHVVVKGGKNITKIMRNPALKDTVQEISVYAYKGEKVSHALKRDGRLLDVVFKKTCVLSHIRNEEITEMSSLVDNLHQETVKIIQVSKSSQPPSQPSSLDSDYMTPSEAHTSDSAGNQDPSQQSTSTESENDMAPEVHYNVMQDSQKLQVLLSAQFKVLVKGMKTKKVSKPPHIQNLFREEYGKKAETCMKVKTVKKLVELSHSVCHVRINGRAAGTGFLLFDKFVLTNAHVIKTALNDKLLVQEVTVHFSDENLDEMETGAGVEAVAGFEHYTDESGHTFDWALLRLADIPGLPDCLLTKFGFLPCSGGICIIGHPDGGVKKIDPCLIVPTESRNQVVEKHYQENPEGDWLPIQFVTRRFFENVAESVKQKKPELTYESCFYFGSSGSPVFDEHCNVVAVHSGGYCYKNARNETQSVIEYGYPLSDIIKRIIIQIVEREMFDVLKKFRNAVNNPAVTCDESLKTFFQFFCQSEEPV